MELFQVSHVKLDKETVAERLRSARQKRFLSLRAVANELNINIRHLATLEHGHPEVLPGGIYGRNFLREYSNFLNLDYNKLLKDFEIEKQSFGRYPKSQDYFFKPVFEATKIVVLSKVFKGLLVFGSIVLCLVYFFGALRSVFLPPDLALSSPAENFITNQTFLDVSGYAEKDARVSVNNEVVSEAGGNFFETILLKKGINTLTVTAEKSYGQMNTIRRQILVK